MFASCDACVAPSTPLASLLLLLVVIMIAVVTFIIHRQTGSAKTSGLVALVLCGIAIAELLVSSTGVLTKFDQVPPSMVILLVPCLLINIYFSCFVKLDSLKLDQVPLSTLVGFQCFRFGPELFLHLGYLEGSLPAQMTYPPDGRNIDVIVAAFALCLWLLSLDLDLRVRPLTSPKSSGRLHCLASAHYSTYSLQRWPLSRIRSRKSSSRGLRLAWRRSLTLHSSSCPASSSSLPYVDTYYSSGGCCWSGGRPSLSNCDGSLC